MYHRAFIIYLLLSTRNTSGFTKEDFDCDLLPHPLTDLLTELVTDEVEAGADCGDVDDYVVVP